jgi:hypothetical protein
MEEGIRNAYKMFVGKPERKTQHGIPRSRCKGIKT